MPVNQLAEASIVASARIHLGLISMHAGGPRMNGGIGFAIVNPIANVNAKLNYRFTIRDSRPIPLLEHELDELIRDVEVVRLENGLRPATITIFGPIRSHVGMGSGTAIRLAILEALFALNGQSPADKALVANSKRGGTSGVGVTSYFSGGMILDLGRPTDGSLPTPSSQSNRPVSAATILPTLRMPDWPLCVCIPERIRAKTQREEVEFFERVLPLAIQDSYRTCYEAVFGIYAAVKDHDYQAFCRAVTSIQTTTWKALEWNEYGGALQRLKGQVERFGVDCVGMSSLGPSLFCFATPQTLDRLVEAQLSLNCEIYKTRPNNSGRVLRLLP
ncbi:hypothetical protein RX330_09905 [Bradyrhizobium sp. NDS-1]|uniref:beta-ribofuranosylaminobenzene 5'-phosphate synthase family protein n=1 Tax=Bradyrhizobium sp. NDS-1 TaxID=3080014 RepID=UPI00293F515F|nr:beta-ribofuranosylaminobenzene 5'-phosphate synthase family protein [Bradyrhizobium sp. NDS-1]WOH75409.1 hypothetical protein RX330_09905 [Bradyrhizobium sp. NDS-1]